MPEFQGFHYIAAGAERKATPLMALHGSSGTENDLLPLAELIAPDRPVLAVRGGVDWEGGHAFFRRNADRTLDADDLKTQTMRLCAFIDAALSAGILARPPILLGYSNGAIMAASILHQQPALVGDAVLIRPLSPAPGEGFPSLASKRILILSGKWDQRRAPQDAILMARQMRESGARVEAHDLATGHSLHADEPALIRNWLQASSE